MMDHIFYYKYTMKLTAKNANNASIGMLDIWSKKCIESGVFTNEQYHLMRKVATSDHLQKVYRQQQLSTYIAPELFTIQREVGNQIKRCRFTQVPLKQLCKKYLKNKHLVQQILSEINRPVQQHEDSCYHSRIHGKLRLEIYLDEAEIAPSG